jgi:hypothetical protein
VGRLSPTTRKNFTQFHLISVNFTSLHLISLNYAKFHFMPRPAFPATLNRFAPVLRVFGVFRGSFFLYLVAALPGSAAQVLFPSVRSVPSVVKIANLT